MKAIILIKSFILHIRNVTSFEPKYSKKQKNMTSFLVICNWKMFCFVCICNFQCVFNLLITSSYLTLELISSPWLGDDVRTTFSQLRVGETSLNFHWSFLLARWRRPYWRVTYDLDSFCCWLLIAALCGSLLQRSFSNTDGAVIVYRVQIFGQIVRCFQQYSSS